MESKLRRERILDHLKNQEHPVTGKALADLFSVSRQVIVQDIAVLRASGVKIIATPRGYLTQDQIFPFYNGIIACRHLQSQIRTELETIVDGGGKVLDVTVEHPLYGEIKGNLMIQTRADVDEFVKKAEETEARPLSTLTDGVHLHTVQTAEKRFFDNICRDLKEKGLLIDTDLL